MTHISKILAEDIATNIANARFAKEITDAWQKAYDAGNKFADTLFDTALVDSLPDGICPSNNKIDISVNGYYREVQLGKTRKLPYDIYKRTNKIEFDNSKYIKYKDLSEAAKNIESDKRKAIEELTNHIFAFKTVKRLLRDWVEIKSFIPAHALEIKQAIAVPVKSLNARFGLPPKTNEGAA